MKATIIINDNLIKDRINKTQRDKYGQIKISNCTINALFIPEERAQAIKFLSNSQNYMLSTYGNKYEIYQAIIKR